MSLKLIILFFAIFGFNLNSFSQAFNSGVVLGLNTSQIEGDGFGGFKKVGLIVGGFTNTKLADKWSAQFEIYYTNKGSRKNAKPSDGDFRSLKVNLDYIEIPVAIRYHYKNFLFETGLYYGALINSSISNENGPIQTQGDPFNSYDIGGFLGLHYVLNEHINFNLRSKNSILPVRDFENLDQTIGIINRLFSRGWYNVELNFSVRYQFGK